MLRLWSIHDSCGQFYKGCYILQSKIDHLENKLGSSFPDGQFLIDGYRKSYRIDRNYYGGDTMLNVRVDIPSKLLYTESLKMEGCYVEINLRIKIWLLCYSYNINKNSINCQLVIIHKGLDLFI